MVEQQWVSKEFAEDNGLKWDALVKPQYYVHINDANYQAVMDKYYSAEKRREWNALSLWGKIKHLFRTKQW